MAAGAICVSICARTAAAALEAARRAPGHLIELRFDCLHPAEIDTALDHIQADGGERLIVTFRSPSEGGFRSELTLAERLEFWAKVSRLLPHAMLDLESDLSIDTPVSRILRSRHTEDPTARSIEKNYSEIATLPGRILKIAASVSCASEAVDIFKLFDRVSADRELVPIGMGEAGKWTRILGPAFGAPFTYAALDNEKQTAAGQLSFRELADTFRVSSIVRGQTGVFGLLAGDTAYSLSPSIHNSAYRTAGVDAVFIPFQVRDLEAFFQRIVRPSSREIDLNLHGLAVTNPFKQAVMRYLTNIDRTASEIGAVNTISLDGDKLLGSNTDADGFIQPLYERFGDLRDARVAVIGAGGAARACIYALERDGAQVTVFARRADQAREIAASARSLEADTRFNSFDIVVNATPIGTAGSHRHYASPATPEQVDGVRLVYDLVYNPLQTPFRNAADAAGVPSIGGLEMLVRQAARQFEMWTGKSAPVGAMRDAALERLE